MKRSPRLPTELRTTANDGIRNGIPAEVVDLPVAEPTGVMEAGWIVVMADVTGDWSRALQYDGHARQLTLRGVVVLTLGPQAKNLHAVLLALEASGWAAWVRHPLKDRPGGSSGQRLYDALAGLNCLAGQLYLDFHAEANGVRWNYRDPVGPYVPRKAAAPRQTTRKITRAARRKPR